MFVSNQNIHFPDSPRQQNLPIWLKDKTVIMDTVYSSQSENREVNFNYEDFADQIDEGLIYLNITELERPRVTLIYKLPAALRTLVNDGEETENVPTPETYIMMNLRLQHEDNLYKYEGASVYFLGEYLPWFPYTNMYRAEDMSLPIDKFDMATNICTGDYYYDYMNYPHDKSSIMSVINHVMNSFEMFLTQAGNMDLSLTYDSEREYGAGEDFGSHRSYWKHLKEKYDELQDIEAVYASL